MSLIKKSITIDNFTHVLFAFFLFLVVFYKLPFLEFYNTRMGRLEIFTVILLFSHFHVIYGLILIATLVYILNDDVSILWKGLDNIHVTKRPEPFSTPHSSPSKVPPTSILQLLQIQDTIQPRNSNTFL
jgi:hypothetical protein